MESLNPLTVIKILTVIGTRPQFIKAAVISRAIELWNQDHDQKLIEDIIHTGQHYNHSMSQIFFDDLDLPKPVANLKVNSTTHGEMTGRMLSALEREMIQRKPDLVLIYGDTNSTLAGAIAACKLRIPIVHVEAGLRSFNLDMPEEINRILSDQVSRLLLCPTATAVENLRNEGFHQVIGKWSQISEKERLTLSETLFVKRKQEKHHGIVIDVGDVMYDAAIVYGDIADRNSSILESLALLPKQYCLVTVHREENTVDLKRLDGILRALSDIAQDTQIVFPVHPRIKNLVEKWHDGLLPKPKTNCRLVAPLRFFDMIRLEKSASIILTDSGGVQKEAFFHKVPCVTLRDETEWIETVSSGWNQIVGTQTEQIIKAIRLAGPGRNDNSFGDGKASLYIVEILAAAGKG